MRIQKCAFAAAWPLLACLALCGCGTGYRWRSGVPQEMRTVAVPTFRNESDLQEAGAVASRQLLREFQREGTFSIRPTGDAALEVQGTVLSVGGGSSAFDRRSGLRLSASEVVANATVTVVDKRRGKVLVNSRPYVARTTYAGGQDATTARRDAAGRLMDDLARQVVDDVLALGFGGEEGK